MVNEKITDCSESPIEGNIKEVAESIKLQACDDIQKKYADLLTIHYNTLFVYHIAMHTMYIICIINPVQNTKILNTFV